MSRSLEPAAEAVPDCEPAWVSSPVSAPGLTTPAIWPRLLEYISRSLRWRDVGGSHPRDRGHRPASRDRDTARRPIERP